MSSCNLKGIINHMKSNKSEQSFVLDTASERESESDLSFLLGMIFKRAWPVWKRYEGNVPELELEQLEKHGDWPRGLAVHVMQRISKDVDLRKQLEELL